jgi:hypothetical protein
MGTELVPETSIFNELTGTIARENFSSSAVSWFYIAFRHK